MKKTGFILLAFLLVALLVSGCSSTSSKQSQGGSGSGSGNSGKSVTIKWLTSPISSKDLEKFYQSTINQFEQKNPGVKVNWIKLKDSKQQIKQQLVAGAGPDVVSATPTEYKKLAKDGYLLDLGKYAKKYHWKNRYYNWAYDLFQYNGKQMGVPSLVEGLLIYYNKDMFQKHHWKIPKTYSELKTLCAKMKKDNIIPFAFGTSDYKAANEWWITAAVDASFTRGEQKKYITVQKPWNSPQMTAAIKKLKYLWEQGYINDKKSYSISGAASWKLFQSKKAAMKMTGTWGTKTLMGNKPSFKWGTFLIPSFSKGTKPSIPVGISTGYGINAKSKHPDATAAFINFLHSKSVVEKELKFGDYYPIKNLDVSSVKGISPKIVQTYQTMNQAFKSGSAGYVSWTYWPPDLDTYMWQQFDSLMLGQINLKDYMNTAQKKAEKDKKQGSLIIGK